MIYVSYVFFKDGEQRFGGTKLDRPMPQTNDEIWEIKKDISSFWFDGSFGGAGNVHLLMILPLNG